MKKFYLGFMFATTILEVTCQTNDLVPFEHARIKITKNGMTALGAWSAANIIAGLAGSGTSNRQQHYFSQMNVIWGGINVFFAGLGYWGATKERTNNVTLSKVLLHQSQIEKTFLFNAGLDVAYIAGGFYLRERSRRNTDPSKLKGYGNSIILQGSFLLLFDGIMYSLHSRHGKKLSEITNKINVAGAPGGLSITYQL